MNIFMLSTEERLATGFTHRAEITHEDLTESADNTSQALTLHTLAAGHVVRRAGYRLVTPFQKSGTTAYNSNTISIGDSGSATQFVNAKQVNENGTELDYFVSDPTSEEAYEAANALSATFASMASYDLAELDTGEIHVFWEVADLSVL